ncbi:MAG TPA: TonB-dependent receptor plug domain-containing protein [Ignavibacteriaceae bacterium]|nr:TonB-dependent receptor plug domain-containing protein [Ignavibacteriaceae bacterium]
MLKLLSSFVLFAAFILPQEVDSLLKQDILTIPDTNFVQIGDTTAVSDSILTTKVRVDTLAPIQGIPLTDVSTIINKRTFLFDQYRYTGDLLRPFSLNFVKDYGFIGYPNETFIYGVGNSGISYLQDGVFWNDRYTNSLDLNLIQSENIDSIEIVPSPRGFLYGPYNNPVTVNFITRDFISPQPYARIRYYEGPDGEAMFDGKFSTMVAKRWNYSFQLTNRSKDETYQNTDLSIWQFNTKLKYLLSNSINFQAFYYYVDKEQGLNGGIDYDSLSRSSDDPNADLYDPIAAPVLFPNQKLDILQHNVGLRTLAKPFDNSQLDLSIYYRYGLEELRDGNDTADYKRDLENKTVGGALDYRQESEFLILDLFATYEENNSNLLTENYFQSTTQEMKNVHYSVSGVLSGNILNNRIVPSIFYKYDSKDFGNGISSNNPGFGFDIKISPMEIMNFYIGLSKFNQLEDNDADLLELGWRLQTHYLSLDLKYFEMNNFIPYVADLWSMILTGAEIGYPVYSTKGIGFVGSYKFWILLVDANCSYYFDERVSLPEYQLTSGLYINDMFFDNNLDLKAGFKFYYTGEIERGFSANTSVEPTNKLDFNLAGEIQKVAIFYFQWENLFGNEYYITPYYPMPVRNIKFGLAWELFN